MHREIRLEAKNIVLTKGQTPTMKANRWAKNNEFPFICKLKYGIVYFVSIGLHKYIV